jgi:hypothetical protein
MIVDKFKDKNRYNFCKLARYYKLNFNKNLQGSQDPENHFNSYI